MNLFVNAMYYYEPNLKDIRQHEKEVAERHAKDVREDTPDWAKDAVVAMISGLSGTHHHVFDAHAIAIFKDSKWQVIGDGDFADVIDDETQDYPVLYLRDWTTLYVGRNSKKQGDYRVSIDPSDWMDGFDMPWNEYLLEVATKYFIPESARPKEEIDPDDLDYALRNLLSVKPVGNVLEEENLVSVLYRLGWVSSVCWESGIDEGGFEVAETIFTL